MKVRRQTHTAFSAADIKSFQAPMKVGILATVNEAGLPHLTLITTLQASTPTQVIWGQFTEGLSKAHVRDNPRTGFLIMTLDKTLWRGKANWTHTETSGTEFDMYNNVPMFRYNAYFGVHTVHYMDLETHYGKEALPMRSVVTAALKTLVAKTVAANPLVANPLVANPSTRSRQETEVLNPWTRRLMDKMSNLKFLATIDRDGYPEIIPIIQAQTVDSQHLMFAVSAYGEELERIPQGAAVAVFGMSLDMEDVLLRGTFEGFWRTAGIRCGTVSVNWVYNSMPPIPQQIYPETHITPVTAF